MEILKIAIEGSDGAGKETQTNLLATAFERDLRKVERVSFPRYSVTVGGKLLHYALGKDTKHLPDFVFA